MPKITYTCSECQLRFLASANLDIFPTYQFRQPTQLKVASQRIQREGFPGDSIICLLCVQTEKAKKMAKAVMKKGPARKESKKQKARKKELETKRKPLTPGTAPWVPPDRAWRDS
jgi:hypothetical protein